MANKISISTGMLEDQADRLQKLSNQIYEIYSKANRAISLIHEATNSKYSWDMQRKGTILLRDADHMADLMHDAAKIAVQASTSFQNTDKVIRELIGEFLPKDIIQSPPSTQEVTDSNGAVTYTDGEYQNRITDIIAQEKANISSCTAQKYWSWYYGEPSSCGDGWCAVFASYMMEKAGVDVNAPLSESEWFKTSPAYQFDYFSAKGFIEHRSDGYVPQVGDLVFYEGYGGGVGHVAIVTSIENGVVNTLHGNIGQPTIGEIPENWYRNAAEGGYCKILGYGNISAFAASQG